MWINYDKQETFSKKSILKMMNKKLTELKKQKINYVQIDNILQDLLEMDCIKKSEDDEFLLIEKVNII